MSPDPHAYQMIGYTCALLLLVCLSTRRQIKEIEARCARNHVPNCCGLARSGFGMHNLNCRGQKE